MFEQSIEQHTTCLMLMPLLLLMLLLIITIIIITIIKSEQCFLIVPLSLCQVALGYIVCVCVWERPDCCLLAAN